MPYPFDSPDPLEGEIPEPTEDELLRFMHSDTRQTYEMAEMSAQQRKQLRDSEVKLWKEAQKREQDRIRQERKAETTEPPPPDSGMHQITNEFFHRRGRSGQDPSGFGPPDEPPPEQPEHKDRSQPEKRPKILGATILAFCALVGAIATAFQQAGIVNVPLAHIILLVGWLGFVGSFLLLEHVVSLPRRRMIRIAVGVAIVSGLVMLGMDRWMVSLKAEQTEARPTQDNSLVPKPIPEATHTTEKRTFTDVEPKYLVGLYKKYSSAQADEAIKTYIGKWIKMSGIVGDVNREKRFDEPDIVSMFIDVENANHKLLYIVSADFEEQRWMDRALIFSRGEKVTVIGKIRRVGYSSVHLEKCDIVE